WAVFASWRIISADTRPMLYLILVQFLFAGAPMLMDAAIGQPSYTMFPGLRRATASDPVTLVYSMYMALCPPVWWWIGKRVRPGAHRAVSSRFRIPESFTTWVLHLVVLSPVVAAALAPDPAVYLTYGLAVRDSTAAEIRSYHSFVSSCTLIGGLAAMCLL